MAVSKNRKEHKVKVNNFKVKLRQKRAKLEKLYVEKLNEMILEAQKNKSVNKETELK
jgi:hypothetical protein